MDAQPTKKEKKSRKRKISKDINHEENSSHQAILSPDSDETTKKIKSVECNASDQSLKLSNDGNTSENIEKTASNKNQLRTISGSKNMKRNKDKKKKRKAKENESKKVFESMLKSQQDNTTEVLKDSDQELSIEPEPMKEKENGKKTVKKEKRNKNVAPEKVPVEEKSPSAKDQALLYLNKWKNERQSWSFKKVRQVWLMKHMYDSEQVDDDFFCLLLDYLSGVKGGARTRLIEEAESLFARSDDKSDSAVTVSDLEKSRARQILQMLSD